MFNFSSTTLPQYEPNKEFDLLPVGEYSFQIEEATLKETKTGKRYLSITSRVIDNPDHNGRKVFDSLFLFAEKPEYAQATLSGYMFGTGFTGAFQVDPKTGANNFVQLEGLCFKGKIRHKKETYQGEERTKVIVGNFQPYTFEPIVKDNIPF